VYHRIVEAKIRASYDRLNGGDYGAVVRQFAPVFAYHFAGEHALSGTRTRTDSLRRWFERLLIVFPSAHFTISDVLVRGWPWRTTAAVFATMQSAIGGETYTNSFSQHITMQWGRIARINLLEDTQRCADALTRQAALGFADAAAPAIDDTLTRI
jgi:ketosteroid isomerase-like protein